VDTRNPALERILARRKKKTPRVLQHVLSFGRETLE